MFCVEYPFLFQEKCNYNKKLPLFLLFFAIMTRKKLLTKIALYVRIKTQFIDRGAVSQE